MGNVQNCEIGLLMARMKKADNKTAYKKAESERLKKNDTFKGLNGLTGKPINEGETHFKGSKFTPKQQRIRQIKRGFGNTW